MVAGFAEVIEREEVLVAGVGFEPTTSGPGRMKKSARFCSWLIGGIRKKEVVAGVGFEPTTSGL
jgi:hypothetical protein